MRTDVRWSDNSLSTTTLRPEKAEPSRCMTRPFFHDLLGPGFEIARIDGLEARFLDAQEFKAAVHRHHFGRRFRTNVAIGMEAEFPDAGLLDAADARDKREAIGKAG